MRRSPSLTLRLNLLFGVTAGIVLSGFGWFIENSIQHHFTGEDISELAIIAQTVDKALFTGLPKDEPPHLKPRFDDILVRHRSAAPHIADPDGQTIYARRFAPSPMSAKDTDDGWLLDWSDASHTFRVLIRRFSNNTPSDSRANTISVAVPIDYQLRVRTLLRRGVPNPELNHLEIANMPLDLKLWSAVRDGHKINLTNKEFALLRLLLRRCGEVSPRSLIASQV